MKYLGRLVEHWMYRDHLVMVIQLASEDPYVVSIRGPNHTRRFETYSLSKLRESVDIEIDLAIERSKSWGKR